MEVLKKALKALLAKKEKTAPEALEEFLVQAQKH